MEPYATPSFGKMKYGWSKWGGGFKGIEREVLEEWNCQICGAKQVIALPQYFFPFDKGRREFLRICAGCVNDIIAAGVETYEDLMENIADFRERRIKKVHMVLLKTSSARAV